MTTYRVEMVKSPELTDNEVRTRIGRVYALLLDLARREEEPPTADGVEAANPEPSAGAAPTARPDIQRNPALHQTDHEA